MIGQCDIESAVILDFSCEVLHPLKMINGQPNLVSPGIHGHNMSCNMICSGEREQESFISVLNMDVSQQVLYRFSGFAVTCQGHQAPRMLHYGLNLRCRAVAKRLEPE